MTLINASLLNKFIDIDLQIGTIMIKYAVHLIKNTFHPLQIADTVQVEQGQLVLVRTEKGEEVAKVFAVSIANL